MNQKLYLLLTAGFAALGGLLFGYDTGVISGAILFIRKDFALTNFLIEMVISAVLVGAIIGASFAGILSDKLGRKRTLLLTALLFTLSSVGSALSKDASWLIFSRIFVGISIGVASMTTPLYIAEISPAKVRGMLVSLNQLAITVGIVLSYFVDYTLASSENWRLMLGFGVFPAIIFGCGMLFLPESPRWLYKRGDQARALAVLELIHGSVNAHNELLEIEKRTSQPRKTLREAMSPWLKRALVIGVGLAIFQQMTGINTVIYYAPIIFELAGFKAASHAILATFVIGFVNVAATVASLWLIDWIGRRPLLLCGICGMVFSLFMLGVSFAFGSGAYLGYLTLAMLVLYIISFAVSLGPIFWLLIAEIYPLSVRGRAMSIATFFNWFSNLAVALTFLTLIHSLGAPLTFGLYAFIGGIAFVFCYYLVPETKRISLEEIESRWGGGAKET